MNTRLASRFWSNALERPYGRGLRRMSVLSAALLLLPTPSHAEPAMANGSFEEGTFRGWTAETNWVVVDNSCGYYSGWAGKYWAWSGGKGESATGTLKSLPFVMRGDAVRLLISGWSSIHGTGKPRRWNYVTLNLEDGTELDRVYAPDTTAFVPVFLDGSKGKGKKVTVSAVDDADQATFSMLCIDDVRTANMPADDHRPVPALPAFNARRSIRLEDEACLVEVSRSNGSVTRIRDKKGGLDLILEPRLAGSYRFALTIPGKEPWQTIEANWIVGRAQKLSTWTLDDGKLTLRWNGPLHSYLGASYTVAITETIELKDEGLLFRLTIDNPTSSPVGEVYFPIIGGIRGLGKTSGQLKATQLIRPAVDKGIASAEIFRVFNNMSWLGDQGPEQFFAYPESQPEPWVGFFSPKAGRAVYLGARDQANRKLYARLELLPASSGTTREDGNWPRPEELRGLPVGVELSFVDVANCPPHGRYEAAPVFLRFQDGDGSRMRKTHEAWKTANDTRSREVEILGDDWGTPHVFAEKERQSSSSSGYAGAEGRLLQYRRFMGLEN